MINVPLKAISSANYPQKESRWQCKYHNTSLGLFILHKR